jgi:cytochrome c2
MAIWTLCWTIPERHQVAIEWGAQHVGDGTRKVARLVHFHRRALPDRCGFFLASHQCTQAAAADAQTPPAEGIASIGVYSVAGRQVFRKCQACHSLEPGKAIFGPSLAAIIGRKAGSEAGYNYSPAMKQANIVWDAKTLDAYLTDPQKLVPGNKMPFPGLETEQDRADVIAFIATSNSGAATAAGTPSGAPPQSVR